VIPYGQKFKEYRFMQRYAARLSVALVTFLLGTASSSLMSAFGPAPAGGAEREVLEVEREYVRAHMERDVAALERLLSDELVPRQGAEGRPADDARQPLLRGRLARD
jgi:hypothetical protein